MIIHYLRIAVQFILDVFHNARRWILDAIVWLAIRFAAFEIPFADVRAQTRPRNRAPQNLNLDDAKDLTQLLKLAEAESETSRKRRERVTDKCKTLFTFNTALLAIIAIFQGKLSEFALVEIVLVYIAVILFTIALLVLWLYFDIAGEIVLPVDQHHANLSEADLKKSLINRNIRSAAHYDNRTDLLVDMYRTSRFYMLFGFVLIFIAFSYHLFAGGSPSDSPSVKGRTAVSVEPVQGPGSLIKSAEVAPPSKLDGGN